MVPFVQTIFQSLIFSLNIKIKVHATKLVAETKIKNRSGRMKTAYRNVITVVSVHTRYELAFALGLREYTSLIVGQ